MGCSMVWDWMGPVALYFRDTFLIADHAFELWSQLFRASEPHFLALLIEDALV